MLDIEFKDQEIDFYDLYLFATTNNIDYFEIMSSAFFQGVLFAEEQKLLSSFVRSLSGKGKTIKSQLFQDAFGAFIVGDLFDKTFLEFGATDGIELSNSYMLEQNLGWTGVLAEPSPQWHLELKKNRPNTTIITDCIWKCSGEKLDFFMSDIGIYSSLNDYKLHDASSKPEQTQLRIKNGKIIEVQSVSLNEVMETTFNGFAPSYLSIDTEGSEFEILKSFDFGKYRPVVFTVEHNYTNLQSKIDELMSSNGYVRVFRKITAFDAWYVRADALKY